METGASDRGPLNTLVGAVALAGVVAAGSTVAASGVQVTHWGWLLGLVMAFVLADRFPVYYEFREHAIAISLTELPLAVGLFTLSVTELLIARAVSVAAVTVLHDEIPPVKRVFNVGLGLLEATVTIATFRLLSGTADPTSPQTWLVTLLALLVPMAINVWALRWAIRLAGGSSTLDRWTAVTMMASAATCGTLALMGLLLASVDGGAVLLLLPLAAVLVAGYRHHVVTVQDNRRLRGLYALSAGLTGVPGIEKAVVRLAIEARQAVRGRVAEIVLSRSGAQGADLHVIVAADGTVTTATGDRWRNDPLHRSTLPLAEGVPAPALVSRHELAVPVAAEGSWLGSLAVRGHRVDRRRYSPADAAVMQGIANQLAAIIGQGLLETRLREAEAAEAFLSTHDPLTGLRDRAWFRDALSDMCLVADPTAGVWVVVLDLWRFGELNEWLGLAAGDEALRIVAARLRDALPDRAVVARLGGDQFAAAGLGRDGGAAAQALVAALAGPMELAGQPVDVRAALGLAEWPEGTADSDQLLHAAHLALSVARRHGSPSTVRYDERLEAAQTRRASIARDLAAAIREGQISLVYQPVVSLSSGRLVGVEALARWTHPTLGPVSPAEFVPIAEQHGTMAALTSHVLTTSCAQAASWRSAGIRLSMAVNVSTQDLGRSGFAAELAAQLGRHGLPPDLLTLELTETAMIQDQERTTRTMRELVELGVELAIDDFGTGHATLAYVRDVPAAKLKIDRSFVSTLNTTASSRQIVHTVVGLARELGMLVVAEGIEDVATWQALREMGVDLGQGWAISRPLPAADVEALQRAGRCLQPDASIA